MDREEDGRYSLQYHEIFLSSGNSFVFLQTLAYGGVLHLQDGPTEFAAWIMQAHPKSVNDPFFVCYPFRQRYIYSVSSSTRVSMGQIYCTFSIVIESDLPFPRSRIANDALMLSEKLNSSEEMAEVHLYFQRGAGQLESFQLGAAQLRKSFTSGLSSGNTRIAFYCAGQGTHFSIMSAEKELTSLLHEIDYYLHLLETYKSELTKKCLHCYRETVSTLIDKGQTTANEYKLSYADVSDPGNKHLELFYFHQVFRNHWLGYSERCQHYIQRYDEILQPRLFEARVIKFYHGKLQPVYFGTPHRHARDSPTRHFLPKCRSSIT